MFKRMLAIACVVMGMFGAWTGAAAPPLPEKAIGVETIMLIHIEASALAPDALRDAAQFVLGQRAGRVEQQISKFQDKYEKAVKAGVVSMTIVASAEPPAKPDAAGKTPDVSNDGIGYIQLKAGADAAAVQKLVTEDMDAQQQARLAFSHEGNFLVMHDKTEKPPAAGDRARAAQFADAINQSPAAGVVMVFVPNEPVRTKYDKEQKASFPPIFQQMAAPILTSKWACVAINVGKNPALVLSDSAADEASAKQLSDSLSAGLAQLKQMAQNNQPVNDPLMGMLVPMVAPLTEALKPTQAGNKVTVTMQGEPLKTIGQTAMALASIMGMGGGQGPGPGAGGGPGRFGGQPAGPGRGQ